MPIRRRQHLRSISAAVLRSPGGPLVIENLVMEGLLREEVLVLVAGGIRHTDIDFYDRGASVPVVLATRVQASSKRLARPWRVRSAAIKCRALLPVVRPLPRLQGRPPGALQAVLGTELWLRAPRWQQCVDRDQLSGGLAR